MLVIPAIDLRHGQCVRLYQGRADQETVFNNDPVAVARDWEARGASWIHIVDLDGAFSGRPQNLDVIAAIVKAVTVPVQLGGGIRTWETIDSLLTLGVSRVILGTVAATDPELVSRACQSFGEGIMVGIDAKQGKVAIAGWETTIEKNAVDMAREIKNLGVTRILYTDTGRDGTLEGANFETTREMALASGVKVIAAGGVASLDDIKKLKPLEPLGVEGVILGKSLYTGAIKLEDALACA